MDPNATTESSLSQLQESNHQASRQRLAPATIPRAPVMEFEKVKNFDGFYNYSHNRTILPQCSPHDFPTTDRRNSSLDILQSSASSAFSESSGLKASKQGLSRPNFLCLIFGP